MTEVILTSLISFASTNIDDIFILMLLFAQAFSRRNRLHIVCGQYLGIGVLTGAAMLLARMAQALPDTWIGLLGLVPIALGVKSWFNSSERCDAPSGDAHARGSLPAWGVMSLTIANGADNIGVYVPVFSTYSFPEMLCAALVFLLLTGLWCLTGSRLAELPMVQSLVRKYQRLVIPVVLILLGLMILSGSFAPLLISLFKA